MLQATRWTCSHSWCLLWHHLLSWLPVKRTDNQLINHLDETGENWKASLALYNLEGSLFQWANENRELLKNLNSQTGAQCTGGIFFQK